MIIPLSEVLVSGFFSILLVLAYGALFPLCLVLLSKLLIFLRLFNYENLG